MAKRIQPSFTAGELDPKLHARVDLAKYQSGAARLLNFQVLPTGGVSNRAGTEFIGRCASDEFPVRLVEFQLDGTDTCILEFGHLTMRVLRQGAFVAGAGGPGGSYMIPTPYDWIAVRAMVLAQTNDVLKITHQAHPPRNLSRFGLADWRFSPVVTAPPIPPPADIKTRVNTRPLASDGSEGGAYPQTYQYCATNVDAATGRETAPSPIKQESNDLLIRGYSIDIGVRPQSGASIHRIYKATQSTFGLIFEMPNDQPVEADGYAYFRDSNYTPDLTRGPPKAVDPFFPADHYPRANSIYQQRTVYGGPSYKASRIDLSQSSDFDNFYTSIPSQASDAIVFALASRQRQDVLFFVPVEDLIVFTTSGEWRVRGDDSNTLSASTIDAKQQSAYGCSPIVQPIIIGQDIIFVQAKGQQVRNITYDFGLNRYAGVDMSLLCRHLFEGRTVVQMAYAAVPFSSLYFVMSDGAILACSYLKDQEVLGWSEFKTDGVFESVAVISEGQEDVPYFVVVRFVNGQFRRYIERQRTRELNSVAASWFVDSGLTRFGASVSRVTGLDHLEGKRVSGVADGTAVRDLLVTGGAVNLPNPATLIVLGLPYDAVLETLDIDVGAPGLYGELRNVTKVVVHVNRTIGLKYGQPDGNPMYEHKPLSEMGEYTVGELYTGSFEARFEGDWNRRGRVKITASLLPATILAVSPEFETGGDTVEQSYVEGEGNQGRRRSQAGGRSQGV